MGIYNTIRHSDNRYRFHMPGHSGCELGLDTTYDITELSYSDNLLFASGAIRDTERKIAEFYTAKYALMFTCGATSAIAAVMAMIRQTHNEPVIYACGKTHKSTFSQADINGIKITEIIEDANILYNTAPDYFGKYKDGFDVKEKHGRLSIIDASHAAHYPLINKQINNNLYDIIIYSMHKTLPVFTGAAAIVTDDYAIYEQLLLARNRTHTTSPSYLIMSSVDKFLNSAQGGHLQSIKKKYCNIKIAIDIAVKNCKYPITYSDDYTRISVNMRGYDVDKLHEILESKGVYVEAVIGSELILIVTPYNYKYLKKAVSVINNSKLKECSENIINPIKTDYNYSKIGTIGLIDIEDSLGKTLFQEIGIYPPGVPILMKGAFLNEDAIDFITTNKQKLFGLINGKIAVFKD